MKIVVDTNIIFSVILNSNGKIGDIIFNSGHKFEFYSCNFTLYEIHKHWEKLRKLSKLSDEELHLAYSQVTSKITFFNDELIPPHIWINAEIIANEIDPDDISFIALSDYLNAQLWTGDKKLHSGLVKSKWINCMNTDDLYDLLTKV